MNVHDLAAGTYKRDFDVGERAARREPLSQIAVRGVGHDNRSGGAAPSWLLASPEVAEFSV